MHLKNDIKKSIVVKLIHLTLSGLLCPGTQTFSTQLASTVGIRQAYFSPFLTSRWTSKRRPLTFNTILSGALFWFRPCSVFKEVNVTDAIHVGCTAKADMSTAWILTASKSTSVKCDVRIFSQQNNCIILNNTITVSKMNKNPV